MLINPTVQALGNDLQEVTEGCLSVPGYYAKIERPEQIEGSALGRDGQRWQRSADGLLAQCIQHECDHLEGRLFVDYISALKRQRLRRKLQKERKQYA